MSQPAITTSLAPGPIFCPQCRSKIGEFRLTETGLSFFMEHQHRQLEAHGVTRIQCGRKHGPGDYCQGVWRPTSVAEVTYAAR